VEGGCRSGINFINSKVVSTPYAQKSTYQQILARNGRLLGARYLSLDNCCDNCKVELEAINLCVMLPTPPKQFRSIYILCKKCRIKHVSHLDFYIVLNI